MKNNNEERRVPLRSFILAFFLVVILNVVASFVFSSNELKGAILVLSAPVFILLSVPTFAAFVELLTRLVGAPLLTKELRKKERTWTGIFQSFSQLFLYYFLMGVLIVFILLNSVLLPLYPENLSPVHLSSIAAILAFLPRLTPFEKESKKRRFVLSLILSPLILLSIPALFLGSLGTRTYEPNIFIFILFYSFLLPWVGDVSIHLLNYQKLLHSLLGTEKSKINEILEKIKRKGKRFDFEELAFQYTSALEEGDWSWKRIIEKVLLSLPEMGMDASFLKYLDEYFFSRIEDKSLKIQFYSKNLFHRNPQVRREAVAFLSKIEDKEIVDVLLTALKDEDSSVRRDVVHALGETGDEKVVDYLIPELEDEYPTIRAAAVEALAKIGSGKAVRALIKTMLSEDFEMRWKAKEELHRLKNTLGFEPFLEVLKDNDPFVRSIALTELSELENWKEVLPHITKMLKDTTTDVRIASVKALENIASEEVLPPLIEALKDSEPLVREEAANAILKIKSEKAISYLEHLKEDRTPLAGDNRTVGELAEEIIKKMRK
ncbi:MAG TPA: HEAT repeat domain-containing protein [Thermoplasmata archaeon]|nr:HEAT repeat domain-containing protein [Thermoplasmata archaeon]